MAKSQPKKSRSKGKSKQSSIIRMTDGIFRAAKKPVDVPMPEIIKANLPKKITETNQEKIKAHPFFIPVTTFIILSFLSMILFVFFVGSSTIGASDSRIVDLSIDGNRQTLPTRAANVGDLLKRLNIQIQPEDIIEPDVDTPILEDNFSVNVFHAHQVTVIDQGKKFTAFSAQPSPRNVARAAGIDIYPEDEVKKLPAPEAVAQGVLGDLVVVDRATPVTLNLYGTTIPVRTRSNTVAEVIKEKNIVLAADDTVQPGTNTPITSGLQVFIVRVGKQIVSEEVVIPFQTDTVKNAGLMAGTSKVIQAGVNGKKLVTYEVEIKNNIVVAKKPIQEVVIIAPINQITAKGTKLAIPEDRMAWLRSSVISSDEYSYADFVIQKESNWRPAAINSSGCIGLGQSCPTSKGSAPLATVCPNWQIDPVCQLNFFSGYAVGRYGSWAGAYNFWQSHHWW